MPEGELPQERPQRGGGTYPGEQFAHVAVTQHRHVIDGIRPGNHVGHQRGDLQPGVGTFVRRDLQVLIG